jgi:hypothetical protein
MEGAADPQRLRVAAVTNPPGTMAVVAEARAAEADDNRIVAVMARQPGERLPCTYFHSLPASYQKASSTPATQ